MEAKGIKKEKIGCVEVMRTNQISSYNRFLNNTVFALMFSRTSVIKLNVEVKFPGLYRWLC